MARRSTAWTLLAAVGALLIAGCAGPIGGQDGTDKDEAGMWWLMKGVQCEPPPWEMSAYDEGWEGDQPDEPFARDPERTRLMRDHFTAKGQEPLAAVVYYDDMAYASVCGGANQWNYWLQLPDGETPDDGEWSQRPDGPPALQGSAD